MINRQASHGLLLFLSYLHANLQYTITSAHPPQIILRPINNWHLYYKYIKNLYYEFIICPQNQNAPCFVVEQAAVFPCKHAIVVNDTLCLSQDASKTL